ncbi:MAG: PAS domain-containing protein [Cyclobacteriaceae bacterium]
MKLLFLDRLLHAGLNAVDDPLEYRRVHLVNTLSALTIALCLILTVLLIIEGLFLQCAIIIMSCALVGMVFYFNIKGWYVFSRSYYLTLVTLVICATSFVAYAQGRFADIENILVALMATAIFLYNGWIRVVLYFALYGVLIILKFFKEYYGVGDFGLEFYLTLQNVSILCIVIFAFARAFRRSLMQTLEEVEKRDTILYSLIDNVPLFIALLDKQGRYAMVNQLYVDTFGKTRDEIIGSSLTEVLPKNISDKHYPLVQQALRGESPEFLEESVLPDGTCYQASGRYVPILDEKGEVKGVTVFVNDVSDLQEAQKKLKKANRTKDQLLSIIAHDLRNPLNLFHSLLSVNDEENMSRSDYMKFRNGIKDKLDNLRKVMDGILDWSKTQLEGIEASPSRVYLQQVIMENIKPYQILIDQKQINFHMSVQEDVSCWMDPDHFKIAVRNVIHNALKYTPEKGNVSISSHAYGDYVQLVICDEGVGMDDNKIHAIKNKEIHSSEPGTKDEMGSGLGLSLTLSLLEANNCEVQIESEQKKGTRFIIRMPCISSNKEPSVI